MQGCCAKEGGETGVTAVQGLILRFAGVQNLILSAHPGDSEPRGIVLF